MTSASAFATALDAAVERRSVFSLIEVMLPRGVVSKTLLRQRLQGRARAGEMDHGLTCMSHKSVNTRLGN